MIKNFGSCDVYFLSGIWLLALGHTWSGIFCIVFSFIDCIATIEKEKKDKL